MDKLPAKSVHYRDMAARMRKFAADENNPGIKQSLLDIAIRYEGLTKQAEQAESHAGLMAKLPIAWHQHSRFGRLVACAAKYS